MRGDRIQNALVFLQRQIFHAWDAQQAWEEFKDPLQHGLADGDVDGVARYSRDRVVKGDVRGNELGRVTDGGALAFQRSPQRRDVARFGVVGGEANHSRFERNARLPQVATEFGRGLQQVAHGPVNLFENGLRTEGDAARPLTVLDLDHSHCRQCLQRFTDCGTADTEASHEIPFGRQESAGLDFTLLNQLEQPIEDIVGEFPAANSFRCWSLLTHWYDQYTIIACASSALR